MYRKICVRKRKGSVKTDTAYLQICQTECGGGLCLFTYRKQQQQWKRDAVPYPKPKHPRKCKLRMKMEKTQLSTNEKVNKHRSLKNVGEDINTFFRLTFWEAGAVRRPFAEIRHPQKRRFYRCRTWRSGGSRKWFLSVFWRWSWSGPCLRRPRRLYCFFLWWCGTAGSCTRILGPPASLSRPPSAQGSTALWRDWPGPTWGPAGPRHRCFRLSVSSSPS